MASLLSLCLLLSVAQAQTPEQRRNLDALRDTLQSITDTLLLQSREAPLLQAARRTPKDALLHLQLGLLELRRAELGGTARYDDAASEFTWAADLAPHWPYAWFGLGLAEYGLGQTLADRTFTTRARAAGNRAANAFARAAVLEPALAFRLEELARRALREREPDRAALVREALRRAVSGLRGGHGARLYLALGRVQRETGDTGALRSLETYLASGENRALAQLELGRTQLLLGDLRGMATYLAGAADEDPVALAEYRGDLLAVANEAELAEFELARGALRAENLRRFWMRRDRLELRHDGERLAEHLRRTRVARREFVLVGEDGTERVDDRGRIYVRHGEPDDRASFTIPGLEPNESWRYHRGGQDLVLHFVARQGPNDFRLVESVLDLPNQPIELRIPERAGGLAAPNSSIEQLLRSRSALAPVYGQARAAPRDQVLAYLAEERAQGRRGIQLGTRSDSYPLRFERELDAWGTLLVAGGSGPQPVVQVVFAIPGYAVEPATGAAGIVYPVRLRFVALDDDGAVVAAMDTVTHIELSAPVAANRSLFGRVAVPVRPGRLVAHAAVLYGESAGTTFAVDTVVVPAPGGGALALGDLVVGAPRGKLTVPIGESAEVAFSPGGVVWRSEGAEVGVEVFGLEPGARAELRVLIAELDSMPGSGAALRWRPFSERQGKAVLTRAAGSGPIVPWTTLLPLRNFKAGSWLLAVEVTDAAGRTARRETRLLVATP